MSIRDVPDALWCSLKVEIANVLTGQLMRNITSDGPVLYYVIGFCHIL